MISESQSKLASEVNCVLQPCLQNPVTKGPDDFADRDLKILSRQPNQLKWMVMKNHPILDINSRTGFVHFVGMQIVM